MTRTGYQRPGSDYDVSLSDGAQAFYFNIKGIPKLVNEDPQTPSTIVLDKAGRNFGTWDPEHAHIEQRTWIGGRGQEEFSNDETKYFDGRMAWTMSPYRLCNVPFWGFADGHYYGDVLLPGDKRVGVGRSVKWVKLLDQVQYARSFTSAATGYTVLQAQIWLRRVGAPAGDVTVACFADSSGPSGAVLSSGTITDPTAYVEGRSYLAQLTMSSWAQGNSTKYWVAVYSTANDSDANHWEIGYNTGASDQCMKYVSSWANDTTQIYFRLSAVPLVRRWHFFELSGALYAVDEKNSNSPSSVYINGDRGVATTGTATVITDTNHGQRSVWPTNFWAGAWVRITGGLGKGQYAQIASNTATALTLSTTLDQAPDTTSEYVIYGTNEWVDITPGSGDLIDGVVKSVAVFNNIAIFAEGASVNCLKMKWDATNHVHAFDDDGTNKADVVHSFQDTVDGVVIWRGLTATSDVSMAAAAAWATDLTFGSSKVVGDTTYLIQGLDDYDGAVLVLKEDGLYVEDGSGFTRIRLGFNTMAQVTNGIAHCVWNSQFYFNWAGSIEQLYGGSVDDIGPWLGPGLPSDRRGHISALEPMSAYMFGAVDAGASGYSSILAFNKFGFCEVFRGWATGKRIRSLKWQACPGTRPRLWFDCGGDILWQEYPRDTLNPVREDSFDFHHEWECEFSTIDMRAARLSKCFDDLGLTTQNLGSYAQIYLEYQLDDDIESTKWMRAGSYTLSDWQTISLQEGDKHRIRYRLRGITSDSTKPAIVIAAVLEAFARTPVRYQWVMKTDIQSMTIDAEGQIAADPEDFIDWLKETAGRTTTLIMRSRFGETMDNIRVVVEPPSINRPFVDKVLDVLGATLTIVVREA